VGTLVGRELELDRLHRFLDLGEHRPVRAMVIIGEPGIGKTTMWEAGLECARRQGYVVLTARASQAETTLPFAALGDLIDGIDPEVLADLPAPQLHALEVALRLTAPAGTPADPLAIAAGLLSGLKALSGAQPLLVAIDDVQWLDDSSLSPILFAVRRLTGDNVRVLLSRLGGAASVLAKALEPVETLELPGLSVGAVNRLLSDRLGLVLARRDLRQLYETTHGNPLFSIELGRLLSEKKVLEVGTDLPIPRVVEELFGTRIRDLSEPIRKAVLAVALNADLTRAELATVVDPLALEDAITSGLLLADGQRIRPSHPLLAVASRHQAGARERQQLHLALASAVTDETLRARHLAMATAAPDEDVAAYVASASAQARERGAVWEAGDLAVHALRLTPRDSPERAARVLTLAHRHLDLSEISRMVRLLTVEIDTFASPRDRAQAHLLLGIADDSGTEEDHIETALAEAGSDVAIRASALGQKVGLLAVTRVQRLDEADDLAKEALAAARQLDPEALAQVRIGVSWARLLRGLPFDEDAAFVVPSASPAADRSLARARGLRHAFRGEIHLARAIFERLRAETLESGELFFTAAAVLHLSELAVRAGDVDRARRELPELTDLGLRSDLVVMRARMEALVAAIIGTPAEVDRWVVAASEISADRVPVWDSLEMRRALGISALFEQDAERAVAELGSVWEHTVREHVDNPGAFPVAADLVDSLILAGEMSRAGEVTDRLRCQALEQDHPWGLVTATRCDAFLTLADRYDQTAVAQLREAIAEYARLGLSFDRARSLLALGRAERRYKKNRAARASLAEAAEIFDQGGSTGWAGLARADLARVSGRRRGDDDGLTPSEQQVATLAASGMSNKEIAARLFVSVYTVEAHLSHAYAKLGVRSRSQLALRLEDDQESD
jgi:DNA-binding CsgD family transcriptional regulator